jgi:diguanylate cyclase (GGDEF)-like protein
VHDPVVRLTADGDERAGAHAVELLGGGLLDVLDAGSVDTLRAAAERAPARHVELTTLDGRVLDATVLPAVGGDPGEVEVHLRDVSRYASAAEQLGTMAVALARRNRDLRTLHEAAGSLDATTDVAELAGLAASIVGGYLDADAVEVDVLEVRVRWPEAVGGDGPARGMFPLRTARGVVGRLRWWRRHELATNEQETLPLLLSRIAIGLDHALLLSSAEERAARDPLTGLLNRAGASRALARMVEPYAVALLDLDRFKHVNDRFGHAEGDRVLREVADRLRPGRASDVKARWGGEEFLVAFEHADAHRLAGWLEERLAVVRAEVAVGGTPVTFSAGVAAVGEAGLDAALVAADAALYRAKERGRARVEVDPIGFEPTTSAMQGQRSARLSYGPAGTAEGTPSPGGAGAALPAPVTRGRGGSASPSRRSRAR